MTTNTINALTTLTDWNESKDNVLFKLVNTDNCFYDLSHIPHQEFFDLSIIFYVALDYRMDGMDAAIVNDKLMEEWDVDLETLANAAFANTPRLLPATMNTLFNTITGLMSGSEEFSSGLSYLPDNEIYVLSNNRISNGFASVLYPNVLEKIAKKMGSFYILPSSVQEALIVPESFGMDPSALSSMVREVNAAEVSETEYLSDNVYFYDAGKEKICLA